MQRRKQKRSQSVLTCFRLQGQAYQTQGNTDTKYNSTITGHSSGWFTNTSHPEHTHDNNVPTQVITTRKLRYIEFTHNLSWPTDTFLSNTIWCSHFGDVEPMLNPCPQTSGMIRKPNRIWKYNPKQSFLITVLPRRLRYVAPTKS